MKKRGINIYRLTFYVGISILVISAGMLLIDQKTGWLTSGGRKSNDELILSQIRQQRVEAINNALKDNKFTYKFETSGDNFLTLPMAPNKEEKVKSSPLTLRSE